MRTRPRLSIAALGLVSLVACGTNQSVAPSTSQPAETADAVLAATETRYTALTWYFQCASSPMPIPTANVGELILVDAGPHDAYRERLFRTPVTIKGKLCPSRAAERDAIFIVDVSGSMSANDPLVLSDPANPSSPMTCGRNEAYKALISSLPPGSNIGIVTFGGDVERRSTRLFDDQVALEADLISSPYTTMVDVLCENPGLTNYVPALNAAKTLFAASRLAATKEIYFLTDGAPSDGLAAEALATDMKNLGIPVGADTRKVTIATVMLGSTSPDFLRDKIASKAVDGSPIHANAADADDLPRIIGAHADTTIVGSQVIVGPDVGAPASTLDVMPYVDAATGEFTLPAFPLEVDFDQTYYGAKFEYWDSHRNTVTLDGKIVWKKP